LEQTVIRSEIQHHGGAASYVFSGSRVGTMRELFGDRRRAFYGQLHRSSFRRCRQTRWPNASPSASSGPAARSVPQRTPVLVLGEGHSRRTMLLAHALRRFAFKGRVSTEAPQDPSLSMPHQLAPCRRPLEPTAGEVVAGT
jgi:hypothetical protein